jgi:hypothetical protein
MCDLRAAAMCDATWRPLGNGDGTDVTMTGKSIGYPYSSSGGPLDEYMQGVSDIAFSQAGVHVAARDYGQVRVWDLRVEDRPLARYPVMQRHHLLAHLYDKFEDGVPIDRFRCTFLGGDSLYLYYTILLSSLLVCRRTEQLLVLLLYIVVVVVDVSWWRYCS